MQPVFRDVEIFESPEVDFTGSELSGCSPLNAQLVNLAVDSGTSYHWEISNGTNLNTADASVLLIPAGEYDVLLSATNIHGCTESLTRPKFIVVYPQPTADFSANPPKATIESPVINFTNNSTNADSYFWIFSDSTTSINDNLAHTFSKTGMYDVTLIAMNNFGCIDTTRGTIEISEGFSFYLPNAFTPDGDGKNDFFQGFGSNIKAYSMTIFDRWGEKIFQTSEYAKPWDGRIDDNAVQHGVYVYKVIITDDADTEHEYVGSVTVVR
jgi:gliding motility-associated-like protein